MCWPLIVVGYHCKLSQLVSAETLCKSGLVYLCEFHSKNLEKLCHCRIHVIVCFYFDTDSWTTERSLMVCLLHVGFPKINSERSALRLINWIRYDLWLDVMNIVPCINEVEEGSIWMSESLSVCLSVWQK